MVVYPIAQVFLLNGEIHTFSRILSESDEWWDMTYVQQGNKGRQWQMRITERPSLLNPISLWGTNASTTTQTQTSSSGPTAPLRSLPLFLPLILPSARSVSSLWMQSQLYPPSQLFGSQARLGLRHHHTCTPFRLMQWPWINLFSICINESTWADCVTRLPIRAYCWRHTAFLFFSLLSTCRVTCQFHETSQRIWWKWCFFLFWRMIVNKVWTFLKHWTRGWYLLHVF